MCARSMSALGALGVLSALSTLSIYLLIREVFRLSYKTGESGKKTYQNEGRKEGGQLCAHAHEDVRTCESYN